MVCKAPVGATSRPPLASAIMRGQRVLREDAAPANADRAASEIAQLINEERDMANEAMQTDLAREAHMLAICAQHEDSDIKAALKIEYRPASSSRDST